MRFGNRIYEVVARRDVSFLATDKLFELITSLLGMKYTTEIRIKGNSKDMKNCCLVASNLFENPAASFSKDSKYYAFVQGCEKKTLQVSTDDRNITELNDYFSAYGLPVCQSCEID